MTLVITLLLLWAGSAYPVYIYRKKKRLKATYKQLNDMYRLARYTQQPKNDLYQIRQRINQVRQQLQPRSSSRAPIPQSASSPTASYHRRTK